MKSGARLESRDYFQVLQSGARLENKGVQFKFIFQIHCFVYFEVRSPLGEQGIHFKLKSGARLESREYFQVNNQDPAWRTREYNSSFSFQVL
ncbi:hypothetical protein, partial [Enterobacter hormaechei]|uniref:hypothetical protein n=1 Tax=Enterobacter hormaechei TaxID=158836 RepID=UPI0029D72808